MDAIELTTEEAQLEKMIANLEALKDAISTDDGGE